MLESTMPTKKIKPKNCMKIFEKENINNIYKQINPIPR